MTTATWPADPDPVDPFADQDDPVDLGYDDFRRAGGKLPPDVYHRQARRLAARLDEVLAGRAPLDADTRRELGDLLNSLRISRRLTCDRRTERPIAPTLPSDADLARLTADVHPAVGQEAPDRVLGPLVDELDARAPEHALALRVAIAAAAFLVADGMRAETDTGLDPGQTPFEIWSRRKPLPSPAERAAVRAVERAPWTAWAVGSPASDATWHLRELVGIAPAGLPDAPVRLVGVAAPFRALRPGDTLLARVVRGPDGWEARTPIAIPGGPPRVRLRSWVRLELVRQRLRRRALTVDALLRRRGHVLARRLVEWAWLHPDDDPYDLPDLYDLEYRDHTEDLAWYGALASRVGGPVLELACGTGRLTLALARAGHEVHGVDLSEPMLRRLDRKLSAEPPEVRARVHTTRGDFRTWRGPRRHRLVLLPFNALHHCRDESELRAVFATCAAATSPGGLLAFDAYLADLDLYDRDPDERVEPRTFEHPDTGERIESWEQGWWEPEDRTYHVLYVYQRADGRRHRSHLQLRMFELDTIRDAARAAGFTIAHEACDFEGAPLGPDALKYVAVARRDAGSRPGDRGT